MFVGRENELSRLDGLWKKSVSSLVTIRGRRRIGKISRLKVKRDRTVRPVLVYDGELSKRVPADAFFSFIVSADKLIGRPANGG